MKTLLAATMAVLLTFGAVSTVLACPGAAKADKTTADTGTSQDVKKGS